jgi:serine/threonine-protein kinase
MEYLSGGSLKDRLVRQPPWPEVLEVGREICEGLAFAHKNRIIHGNLRPNNILFSSSGEIKLTDFGLEEHYASEGGSSNWYSVQGEEKSVQTDIYAAGIIFYEMITGNLPQWQGQQPVSNVQFNAVPKGFQSIIVKMISREMAERYRSMDEVIHDVSLFLQNPVQKTKAKPKSAPNRRKWPSILFLLLLLGGGGLYALQNFSPQIKAYVDRMLEFFK